MLLAALRDKGLCLCPRCLVPKSELDKLGQVRDSQGRISRARVFNMNWITRARNFIYCLGFPVRSTGIERMLKPTSLTPTLVCIMWYLSVLLPDLTILQECLCRETCTILF